MFRHEFSNGNACLILDKRYKNKDNKYSLKWRVTVKGKQSYYLSGVKLSMEEYKALGESRATDAKNIRTELQNYFDDVIVVAINDANKTGVFSWERFNELLGRSDVKTVNDAFDAKIKRLREANDIGNATVYNSTLNALKRFKKYKGLNEEERKKFTSECVEKKHVSRGKNRINVDGVVLEFSEITKTFLNKFDAFLRETQIADATIGIYTRTLRALINNEGGDPYLSGDAYPFGKNKYTTPEGDRREKAIPISDVWRIEDYKTDPLEPGVALAQATFMFLFYGNGCNFGDMCRMRFTDINTYTNEIEFKRKKTSKTSSSIIYVPILGPMKKILEDFGNKSDDGYLFPFLNGIDPTPKNEERIKKAISIALTPINEALKKIAIELGLPDDLSTGTARNSYITHLISEEMISEIVVKKMVGHSTRKNTTAGYVNLTPEKRLAVNKKLLKVETKK